MFDFAPVGLPTAMAGILFMTFIGWRLVPKSRRAKSSGAELFQISFAVFVAELVAGVLPSGRFAVVFIDGFEQFVFRGENGLDLHAGEATDGGDGFKVERIGHG